MAKITQGIGKKLNPSEARASISLHKIAQKKPALGLPNFSINQPFAVHCKIFFVFPCRYGQKKDKNGKSVSMSNDKDSTNTPTSKSTAAVAPSSGQTRDESDEKRKIAKQEVHIKKLEKALRQCGRKIQELDEAEIDLDGLEDENSPYMMKTRYYGH